MVFKELKIPLFAIFIIAVYILICEVGDFLSTDSSKKKPESFAPSVKISDEEAKKFFNDVILFYLNKIADNEENFWPEFVKTTISEFLEAVEKENIRISLEGSFHPINSNLLQLIAADKEKQPLFVLFIPAWQRLYKEMQISKFQYAIARGFVHGFLEIKEGYWRYYSPDRNSEKEMDRFLDSVFVAEGIIWQIRCAKMIFPLNEEFKEAEFFKDEIATCKLIDEVRGNFFHPRFQAYFSNFWQSKDIRPF